MAGGQYMEQAAVNVVMSRSVANGLKTEDLTATTRANDHARTLDGAHEKLRELCIRMGQPLPPPTPERDSISPRMLLPGALDTIGDQLQRLHAALDFLLERV